MTDRNPPLELWGGIECTMARVGDDWRDQTRETGHWDRPDDIDLIEDLGIKTVRYPILWEQIAPRDPKQLDWSWHDDRLALLRDKGFRVIGGLLHHGSGPHYTSLVDPDFPTKLAESAQAAAERFPWIQDWTPVNEPLTTARFSGLYGHWYPHGRDVPTFLKALVNQCVGTLTAMRAIRSVIPGARLVQTEDLGKTFSTAPLRYQANHENERRWLSLDLLTGRVQDDHPWTKTLIGAGAGYAELDALASGEATPDLIGINHYLTSERFLDHRLDLYPHHDVGGNGRDRYVDAEAVRVKRLDVHTGFAPRLREAWERYRLPMAITEVHHGCSRDEQLRWFAEVWHAAKALNEDGVDLRAVTLWSMFGNVDWRSLLTRRDGWYDVGVFDARGPKPRSSVIAAAAKAYASGDTFDHPVLDLPGWWRRPARLYPWHGRCKGSDMDGRKLLITGATGTLGKAMARIAEHRGLPHCLTDRAALDICDPESIAKALETYRPWAVVNTAGFVRVADAEQEEEACRAWNTKGAVLLAEACKTAGIPFVSFSSDLVFDGLKDAPYLETDATNPLNMYGISKAAAEAQVLEAMPEALMVRTAAFFGPWDPHNFAWAVLNTLSHGERFHADARTKVSPTYVPDLCHATLDLLVDGEKGLWHVANAGALSWYDFAVAVAREAGLDADLIVADEAGPPRDHVLGTEKGMILRPVDQAIAEFVREVGPQFRAETTAPDLRIAAE